MKTLNVKRQELKYRITNIDYTVFKNRLNRVLKKDANSTDGSYLVSSIYFDDINNTSVTEKEDGVNIRNKYRIRYYNDNLDYFKLERKQKIGQIINKSSLILNRIETKKILAGDIEFLSQREEPLAEEFYRVYKTKMLRPKIIVVYERLAYQHIVGDLRITFDTDIKTSINYQDIFSKDLLLSDALNKGDIVMEIKFNGNIPNFISSIIDSGSIQLEAISKYVNSRKYNI